MYVRTVIALNLFENEISCRSRYIRLSTLHCQILKSFFNMPILSLWWFQEKYKSFGKNMLSHSHIFLGLDKSDIYIFTSDIFVRRFSLNKETGFLAQAKFN